MKRIRAVNSDLIVFSMPGMPIEEAAISCGMKVLNLFLADRAYDANGQLVPRSVPNSVVKDEAKVRARVRQFLQHGTVMTIEGETLSFPAKSILVHSDTPGSLELARTVRSEIEACGGTVAPAREVLA
jgi:UPF0271 protein